MAPSKIIPVPCPPELRKLLPKLQKAMMTTTTAATIREAIKEACEKRGIK